MSEILYTTLLAVLIWSIGLAVFLYTLKSRWFARFEQGFFFALVAAIAGVAILATSVTGIWGYLAAKHSIHTEIVTSVRGVGDLVEAQVLEDLGHVQTQLERLAAMLGPIIGPGARLPAADLQERLRVVRSFDPNYLQIRVLDRRGQSARRKRRQPR